MWVWFHSARLRVAKTVAVAAGWCLRNRLYRAGVLLAWLNRHAVLTRTEVEMVDAINRLAEMASSTPAGRRAYIDQLSAALTRGEPIPLPRG